MLINHVQTLGYRRLLGAFGVQQANKEEPCQGTAWCCVSNTYFLSVSFSLTNRGSQEPLHIKY